MLFNRTSAVVALGLLASLWAAPSLAQGPLGMQLFAPADVSTFGGMHEPNEGYFFQYDLLYWSVSGAKSMPVGKEGLTRVVDYGPPDVPGWSRVQSNTLYTANEAFKSLGNRFEFGRVENRNGWLCSFFQLHGLGDVRMYDEADMVINDLVSGEHVFRGQVGADVDGFAIIGDLPITLYDVTVEQHLTTWNAELMYLHRALMCHDGSTLEFFLGARYFELNDKFYVLAGPDPGGILVPSILADSSWEVNATNHVAGPQIGLRWSKTRARWSLGAEGRFLAGINAQNIHEVVDLGPNLDPGNSTVNAFPSTVPAPWQPLTMAPVGATHDEFACEWSPMVELRVEARYQFTRAFSVHAGWTGFWVDGIARANGLTDYSLATNFGIDMANNRQGLFMHGLTVGCDFNR